MKKTILTLASIAALVGAASAQTTVGIVTSSSPTTGPVGLDFGGITTGTWTGGPYPSVGGSHVDYIADENSLNFALSLAAPVNTLQLQFLDIDLDGVATYTLPGATLVGSASNSGAFSVTQSGDQFTVSMNGGSANSDGRFSVNYSNTNSASFSVNSTTFPVGDTIAIRAYVDKAPEPSSAALLGLGALGLLARRKR